jgi:hypothetical protein
VKSLACAAIIGLAVCLAACGGGGGGVTPPPPSGNFALASLKGQYAFSMSGVDPTGAYIARIGSFTADGAGNIITGLEDVLPLANKQSSIVTFAGGSYQVQANGRGIIVLQAAGGGGLQLNMDMQSPTAGFLLQTDLSASTSGTFSLQTPSGFSNGSLVGHYIFSLAGISFGATTVAPISMIGEINADGNGNVTGGVMDTNDGTQNHPSGATAVPAGTYQLDTSGNGTNFGRGSMTFAGRTYAYYIVDATRFFLLEEDALGGSAGDAVLQDNSVPTQNSAFSGGFVYLTGGASLLGTQPPDARVARFTADGTGGLTSINFDENSGGNRTHLGQSASFSNTAYSIDTTVAGSGRGTFTFKNSGNVYSDVFYMISSTQGVIQDVSSGIVATGPIYAQSAGPFTLNNLAGNYVFNWSGVQLGSSTAVPFEEDFIGQYVLSNSGSSNSVSGVIDYVELGLSSNSLFSNIALTGNLVINSDGTADNKYTFVVNSSPSLTIHYQVYFVSPSTAFMITADSNRTTAAIIKLQAP